MLKNRESSIECADLELAFSSWQPTAATDSQYFKERRQVALQKSAEESAHSKKITFSKMLYPPQEALSD